MELSQTEDRIKDSEFTTSPVLIDTPGTYKVPSGVGLQAKSKFTIFTNNDCFSILPKQTFVSASDADDAFTINLAEGDIAEFDLTHSIQSGFEITKIEDNSVAIKIDGIQNEVEEVLKG